MKRTTKGKRTAKLGRAKRPSGSDGPVTASGPAREEIERRAYELYLARGGLHGHDLHDWLQAERELGDARSTSKGSHSSDVATRPMSHRGENLRPGSPGSASPGLSDQNPREYAPPA